MAVSEQDYQALALKVEYLIDRQEIIDCINRYGRGLDRLDAEQIRSAFHAGGIDDHGAFVGTVEEFVPWAIECESAFKLTHHSVSSHNCGISGNEAHAESYVSFSVVFPDRPVVGVGAGRYIDRLEKKEGVWGLVVRRFVMDWIFEQSEASWLGPEWSAGQPKRDPSDLSYQRPLQDPTA